VNAAVTVLKKMKHTHH